MMKLSMRVRYYEPSLASAGLTESECNLVVRVSCQEAGPLRTKMTNIEPKVRNPIKETSLRRGKLSRQGP